MGDNHVCSFCAEKLVGKQHIKIVFENWPVEETITYRRKGKERTTARKLTKEVITALGMECINNPERWKDYDIDPGKVADFFEDLRFVGKNPVFSATLAKDGAVCLSLNCSQRTGSNCQHLLRHHSFDFLTLDELTCEVGHPGRALVRQGKEERTGILNPLGLPTLPKRKLWQSIWGFAGFAWKPQHGFLTRTYFGLTYTGPLLFMLALYLLVAYPFWWILSLKNRVATLKLLRI